MRGETAFSGYRSISPNFNPLSSCEGRRVKPMIWRVGSLFQSTPLMRGETAANLKNKCDKKISIHSPHARGDSRLLFFCVVQTISIHSPHARGDLHSLSSAIARQIFQSTPLMRGETTKQTEATPSKPFQSTPLMRGETVEIITKEELLGISIHSPHARGDPLAQIVPNSRL